MSAKNRNAAQIKRLKLNNNATSKLPLRCQVPHCEEDFYIRYIPADSPGKFTRRCLPHYKNPPQKNSTSTKAASTKNLLKTLGLI